MPRHLMTGLRIGQEISKYAVKYLPKFKRYEDRIWKGLYPHKSSRWVVRGSLVAGDVARQLYNEGSTPFEGGQIPTNNPYKKGNSRQYIPRRNRRNKYNRNRCNCRKRLYRRRRNYRSR